MSRSRLEGSNVLLVYVMIGSGGMIVTAQLGPIARDFGVEKQMIAMLGRSMPLVALAVSIDNLANGLTRPFSGFLSDRIGRENAMLLMFSAEGVAFLGMAAFGRLPLAFLVFAALIFLFWGEIFSLFPAICGDIFGVRNATANNGLLYTAKGTSALTVPAGQSPGSGNRHLDGGVADGGGFERGSGVAGEARGPSDAAQDACSAKFAGRGSVG